MKRVLLIGPAPVNTGGISIHMRRLVDTMEGLCEFDYVDEFRTKSEGYFNLRSLNVFKYLAKVIKADVVHINSGAMILRLFNVIACRVLLRKYTIVTVHRDPAVETKLKLTRFLLSLCNVVIVVNQSGYKLLKTDGKCDYRLLPAFLPPIMDKEAPLDDDLKQWIAKCRADKDSVLMVSNASGLRLLNGEDLYGLDLCLEAVNKLKDEDKNFYLIFIVIVNYLPERLVEYKKFIADNGLQDRVLILEKACSFVRLMQESDIVLRTTNTDGDSISVRESLAMGVPIIASDVVERPEGTVLFKNRDADDLVEKIKETAAGDKSMLVKDDNDYKEIYSKIYRL